MEELIEIDGTTVRVTLPDRGSMQRHPLLLVLDGRLHPGEWTAPLHAEGILPKMVTALVSGGAGIHNPATLLTEISKRAPLLENPSARWIVGTAHSGVTAIWALLNHPDLFGAAIGLSSSFEGIEGAPPLHSTILRNLEVRPALPEGVRLYADHGTIGLDECYEPYHRDLGAILRQKGWVDGKEFVTPRISRGSHDPASWQNRLGPALRWLAKR